MHWILVKIFLAGFVVPHSCEMFEMQQFQYMNSRPQFIDYVKADEWPKKWCILYHKFKIVFAIQDEWITIKISFCNRLPERDDFILYNGLVAEFERTNTLYHI